MSMCILNTAVYIQPNYNANELLCTMYLEVSHLCLGPLHILVAFRPVLIGRLADIVSV